MNRKAFLYNSSVVLGATLLGCKSTSRVDKSLSNEVPTFDLHTHPGVFFRKGSAEYDGDAAFINRVAEMQSNGLDAAFFSLVADWPLLQITETGIIPKGKFEADEGWKVFKEQLVILKDLLEKSKAKFTVNASELTKGDHVKAYIACEGGDFLGGHLERVAMAYAEGVRSIQLVHYAPNDLGDLQTWKADHGGLSEFGKAVVKEMNKLGMLIDVAHASAKTVKDVVSISKAPVILSHSILKTQENRPISARAINEGHAKLVSDNGGVIGMWPSGFSASFEEFVAYTLRMIEVVGIDHVGIGTDMDANYKPVIKDYGGFVNWKKALAEKGLSESDVAKLAGGNAQRVLRAVVG